MKGAASCLPVAWETAVGFFHLDSELSRYTHTSGVCSPQLSCKIAALTSNKSYTKLSRRLLSLRTTSLWGCFFICKSILKVSFRCDSTDCSPPVSSVHGIAQATILEWVAISFSRGSFQPRSPALQADSLPSEPPRKPYQFGPVKTKKSIWVH